MSANGNGKVSPLRQKMTEDLQIRTQNPKLSHALIPNGVCGHRK